MSNILKPKAMPASAAAQSKPNPFLDSPLEPAVNANISKPNPFFDSPISDEYSGFSSQDSPQDVMRTPGSAAGSAFTPVKPSVHIKGWDTPEGSPKSDKENSTSIPPSTNNDVVEEKPEPSSNKVKSTFGEKTALFREQVRKNVPKPKVNSNKVKEALEGKKAMLRKNMEQVKKNVPKPMNMNHLIRAPKKNCVDLADLSIVTISLVPRLGVGMRSGRKPFERMRTSLMLHLMQEIKTKSWTKHEVTDGENGKLDQDELASKLNNMMYDCIANGESTFVEKSQDIVKIARETVEEIKDSTDKSFSKSEVGRRNLLSAKFFSSGYREIVADENLASDMKDGMSLMVVASAYYALGKFEWALEVYQRAGVELKKKIAASSPEYIVYCTKLFNNMACVYFEMKKYDKAMKTWQRALELCNDENEDYAFWTASILDQVSIMNNMAYLLIKFRLFDDATDLIDSSFELQQIIPEFSNQIMNIATLSTMGFIYYQTKQHKASFDTYKACVQLQENTTQHTERDKVDVLTKMSANCKKMKDHEKRVLILRCILVYQQCYLLEDDDEIWETNAAMAESLQEYADAGGDHI